MIRSYHDMNIVEFYKLQEVAKISDPYIQLLETLKILSQDPDFDKKPVNKLSEYQLDSTFLTDLPDLYKIEDHKQATALVDKYGLYVADIITAGQWIDYHNYMKMDDSAERMINVLSILLIKKDKIYFDETNDDIKDIKDIISKMSMIEVISLMNFFINRSKKLYDVIPQSLTVVMMKWKVGSLAFNKMISSTGTDIRTWLACSSKLQI